MNRDFFTLQGDFAKVDAAEFIALLNKKPSVCENMLYEPTKLKNPYQPGRYKVKGVAFRNVSFSHTTIIGFEFTDCTFQGCLFIGTIFRDCRFTSGSFIECNPYRIEFQGCYVDPRSFDNCIHDHKYSNIGVYLFQEILRNSRQQGQPEFSDEARFRFMKWKRNQIKQSVLGKSWRITWRSRFNFTGLSIYEFSAGYGMRLGRLTLSSACVLFFFSAVNWKLATAMGLPSTLSPVDAFYFSTVTVTTLGFGDITPTTPFGRVVVSGEAITGFVLFALLTSTMYRKFNL
jgi:uncharacterized protein YjbI with pentapeptide repeats